MKVMVVEDEAIIAMIMEDMLTDLGCEVVGPFAAVAPALACLDDGQRVDAALLDVNLGGEKVFPVAAALLRRGTPFAFATGYGAVDNPDFDDTPVLTKPVDIDRLSRTVTQFRGGC